MSIAHFTPYETPNSDAPKLKKFARRLLAYEAASDKPGSPKDAAAFRICEKLREPLGRLMGIGGFHALLARALALAAAEIPSLRALRVKADGSLEGWNELAVKASSHTIGEGAVVLVQQLLGLLVTFIGSALTLRLLQGAWPNMEDVDF